MEDNLSVAESVLCITVVTQCVTKLLAIPPEQTNTFSETDLTVVAGITSRHFSHMAVLLNQTATDTSIG